MKKSNILKKSLALLLTFMLVIAMVPVGASAATETPSIQQVTIGGQEATITGDVITLVTDEGKLGNMNEVPFKFLVKNGFGLLRVGSPAEIVPGDFTAHPINLVKYKVGDQVNFTATVSDPNDGTNSKQYEIKIQLGAVDSDTKINAFNMPEEIANTFKPGDISFTITLPYNYAIGDLDGLTVDKFNYTLSNPNAKLSIYGGGSLDFEPSDAEDVRDGVTNTISVATDSGNSQDYTICVRRAAGLTSFAIDGMTDASEFYEYEHFNANPPSLDGEITLEMPYGLNLNDAGGQLSLANGDKLMLKPTFTSELKGARVEYVDSTGKKTALVSGQEVDMLDAYRSLTCKILVTYPNSVQGITKTYNLTLKAEAENSSADITQLDVISNNSRQTAEIKGDQITVTVGKNVNLEKVQLAMTASSGATIILNDGTGKYTDSLTTLHDNEKTILPLTSTAPPRYSKTLEGDPETVLGAAFYSFNAKKTVAITVEPEKAGAPKKTYTLKVVQSTQIATANLTSISLKDTVNNKVYNGVIKASTITFTLPYFAMGPTTAGGSLSKLNDLSIFYEKPLDAVVSFGGANTPMIPNGSKVTGNTLLTTSTSPSGFQDAALLADNSNTDPVDAFTRITVEALANGQVAQTTNYEVRVIREEPSKTAPTIDSLSLTQVTSPKDMTTENSHKAIVKRVLLDTIDTAGTDFHDVGNPTVSNYVVTIPYYDWDNPNAILNENSVPINEAYTAMLELKGTGRVYIKPNSNATPPATSYIPLESIEGKEVFKQAIDAVALDQGDYATIVVLGEQAANAVDPALVPTAKISIADMTTKLGTASTPATTPVARDVYYLTVEKAKVRQAVKLTNIEFTDPTTGVSVPIQINSNNQLVGKIPYSWANGTKEIFVTYKGYDGNMLTTDGLGAPFYSTGNLKNLDGEISMGYTQIGINERFINPYILISKVHNSNEIQLKRLVSDSSSKLNPASFDTFAMVDESTSGGVGGRVITYTLGLLTVADEQTEAEIKSFTFPGSTSSKIEGDVINVTMPFGAAIDDLVASFATSPMATVKFAGTDAIIGTGITSLDYTNPVRLRVVSENGSTVKNYTVRVTRKDRVEFSDVTDKSTWYYNNVMEAAARGLILGNDKGEFMPLQTITRADFTLMVSRVYNPDLSSYKLDPTLDVSISKYYGPAIAWAYAESIVKGTGGNLFEPMNKITRESVAEIFKNVEGLTPVTAPSKPYADHSKISGWASGAVYAVQVAGLMLGDDTTNKFSPLDNISRAEAATALLRLDDYVKAKK